MYVLDLGFKASVHHKLNVAVNFTTSDAQGDLSFSRRYLDANRVTYEVLLSFFYKRQLIYYGSITLLNQIMRLTRPKERT